MDIKKKDVITQDFVNFGIKVKRIKGDEHVGLLLEFPNGNILRVSTQENHHPVVYSHETREDKVRRLMKWYGDDEDFELEGYEDVDV